MASKPKRASATPAPAAGRFFVLTRHDGGVEVMQCVGNTTPETCLEQWHPQRRAEIASVTKINPADIPSDRTFRDAWDRKLRVNMSKARDVWRDKIREARAPHLAALDVEYQRADEAGDTKWKKKIASRKQALRDAPADPRIDAAKTPDRLKAVWPVVLTKGAP